jgi:hypothetical protein
MDGRRDKQNTAAVVVVDGIGERDPDKVVIGGFNGI